MYKCSIRYSHIRERGCDWPSCLTEHAPERAEENQIVRRTDDAGKTKLHLDASEISAGMLNDHDRHFCRSFFD